MNERGTADIFHEISIRRTRTGLGGSRTKLLKMDEISDLPASGLPARTIRQVSAGEVAYSTTESRETYRGYYNGLYVPFAERARCKQLVLE